MKIFIFFLWLASALAEESGEDWLVNNYAINKRYRAGNYLIYDCEGSYYSCVDEDSYELCQSNRKAAMVAKAREYPCAPLKKFREKEKCQRKNYQVMTSLVKKRFCYRGR